MSVTGDTTDEPDETVVVALSQPTNAMISTGTGTGRITDDDGAPTLAINSPSVAEGDSGSVNLTFTVTLSAASGQPVTVAYAEGPGGTASRGTDYTALTAGTLTFAAGETSRSITVSVTGDTTDEPDETVVVELSSAVNAIFSTATGTGMITDDDGAPTLAIGSASVTEGNIGSVDLTFTVRLSAVSGQPVTVGYAEGPGGTASRGTDYTALTAGTLTFAAGEMSHGIDVSVTGDTTTEEDETIVVVLSGPTNATLGTAVGTGTITDDDGPAEAGVGPTFGDATIANQTWTQNTAIPAFTLPTATGGAAPVTYELRPDLPTGVTRAGVPLGVETRAAESHAVTGTPTVVQAETTYRWHATDADGDTATLTFSVEVVADARPTFGGRTVVGQRYVQYMATPPLRLPRATGGDGRLTYTLTPRALPAGLTFDPATRTVSGTPTAVRARTLYTWTARDADGDAARLAFSMEVVPGVRSHDLGLVLAGVGRTLAADAVAVIGGRGGASAASGVQVTLGGQVLRLTNGGTGVTEPGSRPGRWQRVTAVAVGVARALGVRISGEAAASRGDAGVAGGLRRTDSWQPVRVRPVSGKDLLARSAFELPLSRPGAAGVPRWTLWGRGAASGFSGRPTQEVTLDGTLAGGYVGVDYRPAAAVRLGVALTHSTGTVKYERGGSAEEGEVGVDVEVTSVLPYAHWQPRPGLGVWGLLGTGWGRLAVELGGGERRRPAAVALLLGAVGGRQVLSRLHGVDVAAKGDAFVTTLAAEGTGSLPAARGHAERVRLLLEGRTEWAVGAASRLTTRLEMGGRWDRGTAERGVGVEVGGGVGYVQTTWGLSAAVQGRYLVAHEEAAFDEWGVGVNVRLDPGVAGQGAYLTVVPGWGQVRSGVEQLWGTAGGVQHGGGRPRPMSGWRPAQVDVDVGYGMRVAKGRGLLTPYGGMAVAGPGVSRYRLGSHLTLRSSLDLSVEGERAEHPGQATSHGVSVSLSWQW